jgi:hypothetical protein
MLRNATNKQAPPTPGSSHFFVGNHSQNVLNEYNTAAVKMLKVCDSFYLNFYCSNNKIQRRIFGYL